MAACQPRIQAPFSSLATPAVKRAWYGLVTCFQESGRFFNRFIGEGKVSVIGTCCVQIELRRVGVLPMYVVRHHLPYINLFIFQREEIIVLRSYF